MKLECSSAYPRPDRDHRRQRLRRQDDRFGFRDGESFRWFEMPLNESIVGDDLGELAPTCSAGFADNEATAAVRCAITEVRVESLSTIEEPHAEREIRSIEVGTRGDDSSSFVDTCEKMGHGAASKFDVRIEKHSREAADFRFTEIQCVGLSGRRGVDHLDARIDAGGDLSRPIRGRIDHDHDLEVRHGVGKHPAQGSFDASFFVVGWDDDAGHVS
ncbi:MAG: hypothetical protein P8J88_04055 [Phycisphaerales bacterium]|nr:hypothetical protein [Phycisphaerales bacterium]